MADDIDMKRNKEIVNSIIVDELGSAIADGIEEKKKRLGMIVQAATEMIDQLPAHEAKRVVSKLTNRAATKSDFDKSYAALMVAFDGIESVFGKPAMDSLTKPTKPTKKASSGDSEE